MSPSRPHSSCTPHHWLYSWQWILALYTWSWRGQATHFHTAPSIVCSALSQQPHTFSWEGTPGRDMGDLDKGLCSLSPQWWVLGLQKRGQEWEAMVTGRCWGQSKNGSFRPFVSHEVRAANISTIPKQLNPILFLVYSEHGRQFIRVLLIES